MTAIDRREFMKMMGVTAAGTAGLSAMPPAIQQALAIEPNRVTGTILDVEHVVILMQENRSFDHYFGTYNGVRGYTDPRPVVLPSTGKATWFQPNSNKAIASMTAEKRCGVDPKAEFVAPFHIDYGKNGENIRGTHHGMDSGIKAWNKGSYDRWLEAKKDVLVMGHLKHQDVSYHRHLANSFTICDHYHSSVHGDTYPNRLHLMSGTASDPNGGFLKRISGGHAWKTYPERIEEFNALPANKTKKISWRTYQGGTGQALDFATDNFTDNALETFNAYRNKPVKGCFWTNGRCYLPDPIHETPLFKETFLKFLKDFCVGKEVKVDHGKLDALTKKGVTNRTLYEFEFDVWRNKLPNISWIVAPQCYSEHSGGSTRGAYYINKVLSGLVANPKVWSKTVLILNYDENDGYFDHIVPPMPPVTGADGEVSSSLQDSLKHEIDGRNPLGFGPRVPCIVISPWSKGGWVCSQVFDHTSVLQFLEARFGIAEPNISDWRRAVAGDLTSALDFGKPDAKTTGLVKKEFNRRGPLFSKSPTVPADNTKNLPKVDNPLTWFASNQTSNLDGTRKARPLPYYFSVNGTIDAQNSKLNLCLSTSSAGVSFYAYDNVSAGAPKRYTVVKEEPLNPELPISDKYGFSIHGPNGYLYELEGNNDANIDAKITVYVGETAIDPWQDLELYLDITGCWKEGRFLKISNKYSPIWGADGTPQDFIMVPLPMDQTGYTRKVVQIPTREAWYDVTVEFTDKHGKTAAPFKRRIAGHIENGEPSRTDPFLTIDDLPVATVDKRPPVETAGSPAIPATSLSAHPKSSGQFFIEESSTPSIRFIE
ncbi:phosphocholine-specific phospholipase C [Phyllobacterium endophyticum]|uniref:phospholipase C n=1 Tax=Phyllobacterium endophyticum TaxID=1149773 RepID=A0A2P7B1Y1_9HYPH|nr:phospholipase C, phosphocholine-specific [Phyllobacterium endophyticum]MBB3238040.1 phospholipase C [Phyllobacterium endophyticum]PSH60454.1 phospholipase C, phosphocholine-specific [Phyllobacterium endophyticum]TYR42632.1 phospholipase C, phosphocholine-specific [Phyllobacterium endophyticum]